MAGKSHIDGPGSTGRRVESSPPARRQTVTPTAGPVPGVSSVGAGTQNRKKLRAVAATIYSNEQQPIDK